MRNDYKHKLDINYAVERNADQVDQLFFRVINVINGALEQTALQSKEKQILTGLFEAIEGNHQAIRMLLKSSDKQGASRASAMSLVREQIEAVFTITLLCDDPAKWTKIFIKNGFLACYEKFLEQRKECSELARFNEYNNIIGPVILRRMQQQSGVTEQEKDEIEKAFTEGRESNIPRFPTPLKVIKHLEGKPCLQGLKAWYAEYKWFSGFTHLSISKLMTIGFEKNKRRVLPSEINKFNENMYEYAVVISWLAGGYAATEALSLSDYNIEAVIKISDFWEQFRKESLLAQKLWELRVKHLLPRLI